MSDDRPNLAPGLNRKPWHRRKCSRSRVSRELFPQKSRIVFGFSWLLQSAAMKPTLVVCVALALCHSVVAKPHSHHARHASKSPQTEMAGPKSFTLKTADGSVKHYSIEVPATLPPSKGGGPEIKASKQTAALAALAWAPGFYGSTHTTVDSSDFVSGPQSYYLVHLTGEVGGSRQPFYGAVLSNGQIVRPMATAGEAAKPVHSKKRPHRVGRTMS